MIDPRDDLGLTTGFQTPDAIIWPGEPPPTDDNRALLRRAWDDLLAGRPADALGRLSSVVEAAFERSPSFAMRWHYSTGMAQLMLAGNGAGLDAPQQLYHAIAAFKRARDIAIRHTSRKALNPPLPVASAALTVICRQIADCELAQMRNDRALDDYLTALAALHEHERDANEPAIAADIRLSALVARSQAFVGQFNNALDHLMHAKALRTHYGGPAITQWDRAGDEWLRALIQRAQSQVCGGVEDVLRAVVRLFKSVEGRLEGDDEHRDSLYRLYVQIAETYLDLTELYREQGREAGFKASARSARKYAEQAADALGGWLDEKGELVDEQGALLTELALARLDHLTFKQHELAGRVSAAKAGRRDKGSPAMLSPRIYDVELRATELNDGVLLAKAATLRADVLYSQHDYTYALVTYQKAIEQFEQAQARGESARAQYGYRRTLDIL
jgi:hypothetical protein